MKRSKYLIASTALLSLTVAHSAIALPRILRHADILIALWVITNLLIWIFLAVIQWRGNGRWALGIGIYSIVVLLLRSILAAIAIASGVVAQPDTLGYASILLFGAIVPGILAFVNFKLHALRKAECQRHA